MKKLLLIASFALLSLPSASFAQRVYVGVAPPARIVEHHGPRPHPGWVWQEGYHRWDGHAYIWTPGLWVAPPRPHAVWVPGHWDRDRGGYFWVEGHWRY